MNEHVQHMQGTDAEFKGSGAQENGQFQIPTIYKQR